MPEDRSELASREADADGDIVAWWATRVECASAFARLRREGRLTPESEGRALTIMNGMAELWQEIAPTDRVRSLASVLVRRHALRAADAIQLAAALDWAGSDPTAKAFITFDARLAAAAAGEGFTVCGGA